MARPVAVFSLWLSVSLLVVCSSGGWAFGKASASDPTPRAHGRASVDRRPPAIKEYTVLQSRPDRLIAVLPNRMIVIAQELRTAPVVSAQIWVKTGSIYEAEFMGAGLSHFLEHLLSGGSTTTRAEAESNRLLGVMGAQTNAATSLDTVRYYINTTSDHTEQAVALLSDWIQNNTVSEAEFARERDVIQKEFAMGRGEPGRIFWKLTQQARFQHHPARHPTIGYLDDFLQVSRDDLYTFYRRMYAPNNLVMVVAGDIDKQAVIEQAAAIWSQVEPRELPALRFPVEPELTGPREMTGYAAVNAPRLRLAWPGTTLGGEHDYALDLLGVILGQGESSRLTRQVRDRMHLVSSIDAYNLSFHWGEGFFGVDAEIIPGEGGPASEATAERLEQTKRAVLEQAARIRAEGVTAEELATAKRKAIARSAMAGQTAGGLASRLARDVIGMRDPDYLDRYTEALQAITAEQVQAAAEAVLDNSKLITVTLRPLPPGEKPTDITREQAAVEAESVETEAVVLDNASVIEGLKAHVGEEDQSKPAVEFEPVRMVTLDNGLRVLIQRNTLVPAVAVQYFQLGGLLADEPGREGLANAMASMQMRGTRTMTAEQLAETIEGLGAAIGTQSGNNTHYATAVCLRDDLPRVMEVFAQVVLEPSFPASEWASIKPRLLTAIDRQSDSWYGELSQAFRPAYFGDHPWSQTPLGRREAVASFSSDDLLRFHREHLGAEQAVLAIFGDVTFEDAEALASAHFGSAPAKAAKPTLPHEPINPTPGVHVVRTAKPNVAAAIFGLGPAPARDHEDYAALQVWSRIFSRFPSGWLTQALRGEGPGLAYAVWAYQQTGREPGFFALAFNSTPDVIVTAVERAGDVVRRAHEADALDEETLAHAKASVLSAEFMGRQSNSQRATEAALDVLYGMGLGEGDRFMERVKGLDASTMARIAERYLENGVLVVLSDQPLDEAALKAAATIDAVDDAAADRAAEGSAENVSGEATPAAEAEEADTEAAPTK